MLIKLKIGAHKVEKKKNLSMFLNTELRSPSVDFCTFYSISLLLNLSKFCQPPAANMLINVLIYTGQCGLNLT